MSLLNKMLRDLDARHAPPADRAALPNAVQASPAARGSVWLVAGVAIGIVATAGVMFIAKPRAPAQVAQPATPAAPSAVSAVAPAPAPTVAPAVAPAAVSAPPAKPPEIALPAPAPAPAAAPSPRPAVRAAEKTKENAADQVRSAKPLKAAEKVASQAATAAPPKEAKDAPPAAEPSGIEKRPRGSLAGDAAEVEYEKAVAQLRRGAAGAAAEGLRAALRLNDRHVSARQTLLALLVEQRQLTEAEVLLEEGLALDPAQTGWALALARLQFENSKPGAAADTLARHARHAEQNADYQAFRALLAQKQKRPAEAADFYRAALALKPAESRWWYGLGLVLEAAQKPQEARDAYLKAKETGNLTAELAAAVESRLR